MDMMNGSKPTPLVLFLILIFCLANSFKLSYSIEKNSIIFCSEIERQALLSFKESLKDHANILSSWNITSEINCCTWKGVVCSNITGQVLELHLHPDDWSSPLQGQINPSLLNLKHLRYLDLSHNSFEETIPSFVGSLTSLEYLNLSDAGFHGKIPHNIGNLSNLHILSLGSYYSYLPNLHVDSLEWLSNLSQLEHLNMNNVNLSKAAINWVQVINKLPSLVELHFSSCSLNFMHPLSDVNITSLAILDLSWNNFESFAIPKWIFRLSNLIFLDLRWNGFKGPIPTTSNITKLQHIDLSWNKLNSSIPDWLYICKNLEFVSLRASFLEITISTAIGNLSSLNYLDLSDNELRGEIPREISNLCKMQNLYLSNTELQGEISDLFRNMSDCFSGTLKFLYLGGNNLSGQLTDQFGEFESLVELDLSENSLSGALPINLGKLSRLQTLWLVQNKLTGNLPESMGQLSNLRNFFIGDNMLEGVVTESHFANLTKLNVFAASGNHLALNVSPNWIPPFNLGSLQLGSWNLGAGSAIPSWLDTQKGIMELDLSATGISGNVPTWFWEIAEIAIVNLSHNHLYGKIPDIGGPEVGSRLMYLSSNQFSGSLPRVGNTVTELDLSNNSFSGGLSRFLCDMTNETYRLTILHVGGNHLTGELPDCWMKWPSLEVLHLEENYLSGSIPNSIGFLGNLLSLDLHGNKFSGQIPSTMENCTQLVKIDLADNSIGGNIPTWMGTSLTKLRILILRSNEFSGEIPSKICHLNSLQILNLANNNFSGIIPKCVNNFTAMATKRSLNPLELQYSFYSGAFLESATVATKGNEYQYDTTLLLVTNIDVSNNNLSGYIPDELTSLVELRSLNLSGNHLSGLIPESIGNMKQLESLDFSRNCLFGEIPNSFTVMFSLDYLNLSYNNLTGRIPESTQLLGMNAFSFIGNNLCGPPLASNCDNGDDEGHRTKHEEDNEDGKSKIEWFYVFLSLGYTMGFSAVCTTLVFKKSWRDAYFGFLECMWNKLYVYFYVKWRKVTEPRGRGQIS